MAADWSTLPLDLLTAIAFKLESFEDFIYFSAVCRSWNCASSSITHQWRAKSVVLLTNDNSEYLRKIFNLNNKKCYNLNLSETLRARCWGTPYGWIAMVGVDFNVQLFNPITEASICFPRLNILPHLLELGQGYDINDEIFRHSYLTIFISRLVVLKVSQSSNDEFVIMILPSWEIRCLSNMCLAFARQGDQSWTSLVTMNTSANVVDVMSMDNYIYALYNDGAIRYWDVNKLLFNNLEVVDIEPIDYSPGWFDTLKLYKQGWSKSYLVQSGSDLLLVVRYKNNDLFNSDRTNIDHKTYYLTIGFEVYKVNPKDKSWEKIEDLGDVALFVGGNTSMCVNTKAAKSLEGNCIYFTDDQNQKCMVTEYGVEDMGVYDIKRDQVRRFYKGVDTRSLDCPPTLLFMAYLPL